MRSNYTTKDLGKDRSSSLPVAKNTEKQGEQKRGHVQSSSSSSSPFKNSEHDHPAEVSSDEPQVWLLDTKKEKSRGLRVSEQSKAGGDVTCYPRVFGTGGTSAAVPSACNNGQQQQPVGSNPVQHLFFLKTHKTGSLTLRSILSRYALTHNLSVAVRKDLKKQKPASKKPWIEDYRPLPPGVDHYDMITDHVRFHEESVRHFLPEDSLFISIVREPLQRFVSGFYFSEGHGRMELTRIPGPDPVLTYLSNMSRWETPYGSMTHSKMAYDFGLDFQNLSDPRYVRESIQYVSSVFHLVMLTEAYDESMVLLKRLLSWTLPDMLYVKLHVNTYPSYNFTQKQKAEFEKNRQEEYAIYRHFRSLFYEKIGKQDDSFAQEVRVFKSMRSEVEGFCRSFTERPAAQQDLVVEKTRFSHRFRVSLGDCRLLMHEFVTVDDPWFDRLMIKRLEDWHTAWKQSH